MHEHRIFLSFPAEILAQILDSTDDCSGLQLAVPEPQAHHLCGVLRMAEGQELVLVCAQNGQQFRAKLVKLNQPRENLGTCFLELRARLPAPPQADSIVKSLSFALCKGEKNDQVCEKATELGVQHIILWQAERSVVKLKADDLEVKRKRWQRVCEAAACQAGRNQVPEVIVLPSLDSREQHLARISSPGDLLLHCSLAKEAQLLREIPGPSGMVHIIIGPEADFSPREDSMLLRSGHVRASLGRLRLRSETAALAALASAQALWQVP